MLGDSFLSDAAWFFFAAWSVIIAVISFAAFGHDLFPSVASDKQHARRLSRATNTVIRSPNPKAR